MADKIFKVGDEVAIVPTWGATLRIARVTRILKRYLEVSDGSRWTLNGQRYPRRQGDYWPPHLEHVNAGHCAVFERLKVLRKIELMLDDKAEREKLSTAVLSKIVAVLEEAALEGDHD